MIKTFTAFASIQDLEAQRVTQVEDDISFPLFSKSVSRESESEGADFPSSLLF